MQSQETLRHLRNIFKWMQKKVFHLYSFPRIPRIICNPCPVSLGYKFKVVLMYIPLSFSPHILTNCISFSGSGYTAGTPYKVSPSQSNGAPPPYSPSPNTYPSAMYPIRSAYPQQNLYTQVRESQWSQSDLSVRLCNLLLGWKRISRSRN